MSTNQLYYRVHYDGRTIVFETFEEVGLYLEDYFRDLDYQSMKAVVSPLWITEEEYLGLKETGE